MHTCGLHLQCGHSANHSESLDSTAAVTVCVFVCSQAGVSDDTARLRKSGAKAVPPKGDTIPQHVLEEVTHSAASPTPSSYLTSSGGAFDKSRPQTHKRVRTMNNAASASCATNCEVATGLRNWGHPRRVCCRRTLLPCKLHSADVRGFGLALALWAQFICPLLCISDVDCCVC